MLATSTELPGKAAAVAGDMWSVGTRLLAKGARLPGEGFHCTVPVLQLGGEWGLRSGSGGELGGGRCPGSICRVCGDKELVAKSWTWIFQPIPMAAVGCHCMQTTATVSRWPPEKNPVSVSDPGSRISGKSSWESHPLP